MKTNILTLAITLTVGIILAGSLLMPVISDATDIDDTFTNEGLWRMGTLEQGDTWARDEATRAWSYDGETVIESDNSLSSAVLGDTWTVRGNGQIRATTYTSYIANPTITVNEDSVTLVTVTVSGVDGYGVKSNGAYILTDYDTPVYVLKDSRIYGTGVTGNDGTVFITNLDGSIKDGMTITCMSGYGESLTDFVVSNATINYEAVEGYVDLYKLNSVTFDVAYNKTSGGTTTAYTASVSYSSYVVPYEVTAEKAQHLSNGEIAIMNALPVLIIVALVMMAAGALYLKRDD